MDQTLDTGILVMEVIIELSIVKHKTVFKKRFSYFSNEKLGWRYHVASSVSEWIVATIFCFYILSFTDEFKYIEFDHPEISFVIFEETTTDTTVLIRNVRNDVDDVEATA